MLHQQLATEKLGKFLLRLRKLRILERTQERLAELLGAQTHCDTESCSNAFQCGTSSRFCIWSQHEFLQPAHIHNADEERFCNGIPDGIPDEKVPSCNAVHCGTL